MLAVSSVWRTECSRDVSGRQKFENIGQGCHITTLLLNTKNRGVARGEGRQDVFFQI